MRFYSQMRFYVPGFAGKGSAWAYYRGRECTDKYAPQSSLTAAITACHNDKNCEMIDDNGCKSKDHKVKNKDLHLCRISPTIKMTENNCIWMKSKDRK